MLSLKKEKFNRKKDTQRLVMESCTRVINTFKFYHAGSSVMVYSTAKHSLLIVFRGVTHGGKNLFLYARARAVCVTPLSLLNKPFSTQNNVLRQRGTSDAKRCSCQLNISFRTNFKKGA